MGHRAQMKHPCVDEIRSRKPRSIEPGADDSPAVFCLSQVYDLGYCDALAYLHSVGLLRCEHKDGEHPHSCRYRGEARNAVAQ
jgi:hypothetical protein